MRVLVCGGRGFTDQVLIDQVLIEFAPKNGIRSSRDTIIIHGGSSGADTLAGNWAKRFGLQCHVFPADWKILGRAAGPIRNQRMLDEGKPDLVVAFPGGAGTADIVSRARSSQIDVREIKEPANG